TDRDPGTQACAAIPAEQCMIPQLVLRVTCYDTRKADHMSGNKISSSLDQVPRRRFNSPDRIFNSGERPEPMCRVRQFRTGHSGAKVFRSARKPSHLMRNGRAEYQNVIVIRGSEQLVDPERDLF